MLSLLKRTSPQSIYPVIGFLPLGRMDVGLMERAIPILENTFSAAVDLLDTIPVPERAYDPLRRQYSSTAILRDLALRRSPEHVRLLAVADDDLYALGCTTSLAKPIRPTGWPCFDRTAPRRSLSTVRV